MSDAQICRERILNRLYSESIQKKTMKNQDVLQNARDYAKLESTNKWFAIGFFLGLLGVLIAYMKTPKPRIDLIVDLEIDERYLFQQAYGQTLKKRQTRNAWIGCSISMIAGFLLMMFLIAIVYSYNENERLANAYEREFEEEEFVSRLNDGKVAKAPGGDLVFSMALEDSDVQLVFGCYHNGFGLSAIMGDRYDTATYVRITNDPNKRRWIEQVWHWGDRSGNTWNALIAIEADQAAANMILTERPLYLELSAGPMASEKLVYTFPLNGAREVMADFPCILFPYR